MVQFDICPHRTEWKIFIDRKVLCAVKIAKRIFIVFLSVTGILYLYLSNTELFFSEYWLQRKINSVETSEVEKQTSSKRYIKYNFYHDGEIDISIGLNSDGLLVLSRGNWLSQDLVMNKQIRYQANPDLFDKLQNEFINNWQDSYLKDADYKFGGTYYEIVFEDPATRKIEIAFYNVVPDDNMVDFKNRLIDLAYDKIEEKNR